MERRFGADFSSVRVHADRNAASAAAILPARAYTVGRDIILGAGEYQPDTLRGRRLLAHELAHVIQQQQVTGAAAASATSHGVSSDAFEREAESAATRVSADMPAGTVGLRTGPQLQLAGPDTSSTRAGVKKLPPWSHAQLGRIQALLKRLGLYRGEVDRKFGTDTGAALVEAFGDETWRSMDVAAIISRLTRATPPSGKSGEHNLRYGELFKDGLLEMTLGVGYDESGWGKSVFDDLRAELPKIGFEENTAKAKEIYKKTGHAPGTSAYGIYYVWKNRLSYKPPAGPTRDIDVIVRLVSSPDRSHSAEAAAAFEEGMAHSDVAFYTGHGRFGSGPDFDQALKIAFLNPDGKVRLVVDDYEQVETELISQTGSKNVEVLWKRFQWEVAHNLIRVQGESKGNIYINQTDKHAGEFTARLMYWNLNRNRAAHPGATGRKGELARQASADSYRLWVFNGCRTQDYVGSIRSTPGTGPKSTDIVATQRTIYWSNYTKTVLAFMRSILAMQSAEQIIKEMDATQLTNRPKGRAGVAEAPFGLEDNPIIP